MGDWKILGDMNLIAGKHTRSGGPPFLRYHSNGQVERELWTVNDRNHREDGPAETFYHPDGTIEIQTYWFEGICYSRIKSFKGWKRKLKLLQIQSVMNM